jgi:hypothetical protein
MSEDAYIFYWGYSFAQFVLEPHAPLVTQFITGYYRIYFFLTRCLLVLSYAWANCSEIGLQEAATDFHYGQEHMLQQIFAMT